MDAELQTKVFKITVNGSAQDVWREVTKTSEVQGVMFNMQLDSTLDVGSPAHYRSPDGKYTGIVGEVLEFDAQALRYQHSFRFTQYDEPGCKVLHEVIDNGDGTVEYRMTCTQMAPDTNTTKQMTQGGDMIAKNLKSVVETGKLPLGTRILYALFALMAPFSPKKTLTENWR